MESLPTLLKRILSQICSLVLESLKYLQIKNTKSLPNPIMNVDVGKAVTKKIVETGKIEEASFNPILLGITKDKVKSRHNDNVSSNEDQKREVSSRSKGVRKED